MAIKVGILGLGFMGKTHMDAYATIAGASVVAVCDVDPAKHTGKIGNGFGEVDLSGIKIYDKAKQLFADPDIDVVDVALPTYLHAENTVAALEAGKHVICEKPMARSSVEAKSMVAAAKKTGQKLFVAQCLRFWPTYVKAKALVDSGQYGAVQTARFCRLSPKPFWSWDNWLHQPKKSGLCALDLHIHDADFVQHLFGKPKAVTSQGLGLQRGGIDHISTRYHYGANQMIVAEGAWEYGPGYPFSMTFTIAMEKATLEMRADLKLMLYPLKGKPKEVKVPKGDGYSNELKHFLNCIKKDIDSDVLTPESAMHSVKLIEAELESIKTGKKVPVRF